MALHRRTRRQNPHFITERPLSVNHGAHLDRSGDRAVALRRLRRRRIEAQHLVERLHRLAARREHLHARVVAEAGTGRDEPADDHVLLQTAQVVGLAGDRRLGDPSMSASPAFTRSPSWTLMCLPRGIRYSLVSPLSARMTIFRMPLTNPPISTRPSISVMTACSFGLRASNSSATRGRPPVMSLVLVVSRGIFAMMSAAKTSAPSATLRLAPTGSG